MHDGLDWFPRPPIANSQVISWPGFRTVADNEGLDGRYADAGESATSTPAPAGKSGTAVAERLQSLKWNAGMVSEFLGTHLSEPKPSVQFDEIEEIPLRQFTKLARTHGVVLAPASLRSMTARTSS
jgi:50S ribosomal protein L16 3-hydroxylase